MITKTIWAHQADGWQLPEQPKVTELGMQERKKLIGVGFCWYCCTER